MAANKLANLKKIQEINKKLDLIPAKYSNSTRNFTGNVQTDLQIQQSNIAESRAAWDKVMDFTKRLTKAAFKSDEEFAQIVNEAEAYIKAELG